MILLTRINVWFYKFPRFWYLAITILFLVFEGIFTLTIKETQEWKWFCPSVFLYLASVCPSIWLIELDKLDTRTIKKELAKEQRAAAVAAVEAAAAAAAAAHTEVNE